MIHTFADRCTAVYVIVDERYHALAAPHDRRPGPRSRFSDSAVSTLTLVAELLGLDAESAFWRYRARNHPTLFPRLPERSRYNRRRRQRIAVSNRIRAGVMQLTLGHLVPEERELAVIDSLPVPVVGFPHARGDHRWYGEADYGHGASKEQPICGDELHLLLAHGGLILDFALAPANHSDPTSSEQLLIDKAGLTVLGDKGYLNTALRELLAWHNDLTLLTPRRANQRLQLPTALTAAINHFRQIIETVNSQLVEQFHLQRNRAKSVSGLCARVQAKLAAHTLGIYLNCLLGQPLLARKPLALI